MRVGLSEATGTFGLLIRSGELHIVDHRAYLEMIPFGARRLPPPPSWLLPVLIRTIPPIRSRVARAVDAVRSDAAGRILERWIDVGRTRLVAELRSRHAIDLAAMDVERLVDHLDETLGFFERACTEHWVAMFASSQTLAEYVFLARDLLDWTADRALSALDAPSTASTDAAVALDELAELLVPDPTDAGAGHELRVTALLAHDSRASAALRQYLDRFGGRMLGCDPMDRSLAEDPESLEPALEAAIGRLSSRSTAGEPARRGARGAESASPDLASVEIPPAEDARWRQVIARAARYYGIRDESEVLGFAEPMGLVRYVALELGRRLAALGRLERPEDCFMLTPENSAGRPAAAGGCASWRGPRRAEFDAVALIPDARAVGTLPPPPDLRALPPEARFANEAIIWYLGSVIGEAGKAVPKGAVVGGTAASAGRYRGPVRVIRGARGLRSRA